VADLLVKNADYLITMDEGRRVIRHGALAAVDGRIVAVGPTAEIEQQFAGASRTIDASGHLVTPGFVDGHQHLSAHLLRGLGDDVPLPVFLHDRLYPLEAALTEEEAYVSAMCGLLESILAGTTSFCDPGSQRPQPTARAVEEIGARAVLSVSLTDISGGRRMPGTFDSTTERALEAGEAFVASHAGAAGARVRTWFSLRTERMVSDALCAGVVQLAKQYGTGIFSHMISNADSVQQHQKVFGGERPIARYERNGVLGPSTQLAHCSFLDDAECDLLAERGVKVVVCPTSSAAFGWGGLKRGTQLKLLERGVVVGVGSDTAASSHTLDILRIAQYCRVERDMFEDASLLPAESILEHLTINGARAILWDDEIGSLEAGKRADLLLFDLNRPPWAPLHNPISNLAHAATGTDVRTVIIDGQVVVEDRAFVNVDASELVRRGRAAAAGIADRTGLTKYATPRWPLVQ
jgi:cytosine/adenosine deaminase-related metal-dependent hydrolase